MPLCFAIEDQRGFRGAILTFDEGGMLRSMRVVKDSEYFMHQARLESVLPRDLLPQWNTAAPPSSSSPPSTGNGLPPPAGPTYETRPGTTPSRDRSAS
jgi:hypothetical protein